MFSVVTDMAGNDNQTGYSPGHPWYYLRRGKILSFKLIGQTVIESGYQGYMLARIQKADTKAEPKRSEMLRAIRVEVIGQFQADAGRYRECACALRQHRASGADEREQHSCDSVHQSIALKHNHLLNDFATLIVLDGLLTRQLDLFA